MYQFYPRVSGRRVQCLDGLWDAAFVSDCASPDVLDAVFLGSLQYTARLAVPGVFDAMPAYAAWRGTVFYRTAVSVHPKTRLLLKCGGLGMWGAFYWDGRLVGVQDLPYSGMEFCFDSGDGTEHELVAAIDNRFDFARQPLLSQNYDYYCHGGIFRSVELHELPEVSIDLVHVKTLSLDGDIAVTVQLRGLQNGVLSFRYRLDRGEDIPATGTVENGRMTFTAGVPDAALWSDTAPNLHTLTIALAKDCMTVRFGLRIVKAEAGQILLNGRPLKLRGYCRHEAHPEFGPALPLQIVLEDVQLLKATGCNFVRGAHYPQDQRFLDLCDENGILVWEECVGWGDREEHLCNPGFRAAQLRQPPWMVRNSYNHPCVILWGFLNEGDSSLPAGRAFYEEMAALLHTLDDTRLVTYASLHATKDINFDLADVISLNAYPGWYAADTEKLRPLDEVRPRIEAFIQWMEDAGFHDKPFILSEIGAGAIYGWRDRFRAHWSEEYQADYLDEVCSLFEENRRICGIALWQFIDCRTYSSSKALGRPRAFNNKGLFDEYRRPKLAFEVVARHFNGMKASEPPASGQK